MEKTKEELEKTIEFYQRVVHFIAMNHTKETLPIDQYKRLISLQNEYIELLGREINSMIGISKVHHWESKLVDEGIELRRKLEEAKQIVKFLEMVN